MKKATMTKTLRLKLTDFLGGELEEYVVYALKDILQAVAVPMTVTMWYLEKELNTSLLDEFKRNNISLIESLNIQFLLMRGYEAHTWYDIIGKNDEDRLHKFYFRLTYEKPSELPLKLIEFKNFVRHCGQKNEKYSYDGLPKLARQN